MKRFLEKFGQWSAFLVLFFLPWQTRWFWNMGELNGGYFEYGTKSVYVLDTLAVFFFTLRLAYLLKYDRSFFKRRPRIFLWLSGFLALAVFFSAFWALDSDIAFYGWVRFLLAFGLGFFLWTFPRGNLPRFALSVSVAGFVQAFLAITQFFSGQVFATSWFGMASHRAGDLGASVIESGGERILRAYGSFPHPNMLGGFLVFASVCFLAATSIWRKGRFGFLNTFAMRSGGLGLLFTGLFFSFSRSAFIASVAVLVCLFFGVFQSRNEILKKAVREYAVALALVFLIFGTVFPDAVRTRASGSERLEQKSFQERIVSLNEARILIQKFPVQGVGMWNYGFAVHGTINASRQAWAYQPTHNIFLLVWSELGMFGLIFFLGLFVCVVRRIWQEKKSASPEFYFFSAGILAFAIIGFFDHYPWSLASGLYVLSSAFGLWFLSSKNE